MSAGVDSGLDDELQESLFRLGLSGARIDAWDMQERRRDVHQGRLRSPMNNLPASTGIAASHCFEILCKTEHRLGLVGWFGCVTLFDAYCAASPFSVTCESLPAVCAAITNLILKVSGAKVSQQSLLAKTLSIFAMELQGLSYIRSISLKPEDVHNCERHVLSTIRWQIAGPSVHTWVSLLHARLFVLAGDSFDVYATPLWSTILNGCHALVHRCRLGAGSFTMPRRIANGLLGLGLIGTGLLSSDHRASRENRLSLPMSELIQVATACEFSQFQSEVAALVVEFQRPVLTQLGVDGDGNGHEVNYEEM